MFDLSYNKATGLFVQAGQCFHWIATCMDHWKAAPSVNRTHCLLIVPSLLELVWWENELRLEQELAHSHHDYLSQVRTVCTQIPQWPAALVARPCMISAQKRMEQDVPAFYELNTWMNMSGIMQTSPSSFVLIFCRLHILDFACQLSNAILLLDASILNLEVKLGFLREYICVVEWFNQQTLVNRRCRNVIPDHPGLI